VSCCGNTVLAEIIVISWWRVRYQSCGQIARRSLV
jgi:hypothetical protein